jgi:hypothetical protein
LIHYASKFRKFDLISFFFFFSRVMKKNAKPARKIRKMVMVVARGFK